MMMMIEPIFVGAGRHTVFRSAWARHRVVVDTRQIIIFGASKHGCF